jgi:protein-S-isoprenylcysteine O-methyltransferase Ste14
VRRNATLLTLLAAEAGVAALAAFFHLRSRPTILQAFREFNTALPPTAALALAAWFLPSALLTAALCTAVGLVAPLRRSRRTLAVGTGVVLLSFALIFAVWAAFLPIFQPG